MTTYAVPPWKAAVVGGPGGRVGNLPRPHYLELITPAVVAAIPAAPVLSPRENTSFARAVKEVTDKRSVTRCRARAHYRLRWPWTRRYASESKTGGAGSDTVLPERYSVQFLGFLERRAFSPPGATGGDVIDSSRLNFPFSDTRTRRALFSRPTRDDCGTRCFSDIFLGGAWTIGFF